MRISLLSSVVLLFLLTLQSCMTKKDVLYTQDVNVYSGSNVSYILTKIQPNDILKIDVSDLNPVVAAPFNINSNTINESITNMELSGYLVSPKGNITMPILNEVNVGGLTPSNAEDKIKERLINEGYLVSPTVQVRVLNNKFTILGEVKNPGTYPFTEESISLLAAIGRAGDLTYSAIRKDVTIIRELDGKRLIYHVDLTTAGWMSNPVYQIRQRDVVIVKPNKLKANSEGLIKDPLQVIGLLLSSLAVLLIVLNN
jgi:polysaccharide export outer membrane protein